MVSSTYYFPSPLTLNTQLLSTYSIVNPSDCTVHFKPQNCLALISTDTYPTFSSLRFENRIDFRYWLCLSTILTARITAGQW